MVTLRRKGDGTPSSKVKYLVTAILKTNLFRGKISLQGQYVLATAAVSLVAAVSMLPFNWIGISCCGRLIRLYVCMACQ